MTRNKQVFELLEIKSLKQNCWATQKKKHNRLIVFYLLSILPIATRIRTVIRKGW